MRNQKYLSILSLIKKNREQNTAFQSNESEKNGHLIYGIHLLA